MPKCVHGSKVTYIIDPLKFIFLFNALNSAWGLTLVEVIPELITDWFLTTTHPTDGFVFVLPKLVSAKLKANFVYKFCFFFYESS